MVGKISAIFPMIGKIFCPFSNDWKNFSAPPAPQKPPPDPSREIMEKPHIFPCFTPIIPPMNTHPARPPLGRPSEVRCPKSKKNRPSRSAPQGEGRASARPPQNQIRLPVSLSLAPCRGGPYRPAAPCAPMISQARRWQVTTASMAAWRSDNGIETMLSRRLPSGIQRWVEARVTSGR